MTWTLRDQARQPSSGAWMIPLPCILPIFLVGCSQFSAKGPIAEAKELNKSAEKCLLDTRDRHLKYEISRNCQVLGTYSQAYIDAGGQLPDEPVESELIAEQARRMAWTARAISASGNPAISLW